MIEVVVTAGAVRYARIWLNPHHNKPAPSFLQAGCPSCHLTNIVTGLNGKISSHSGLMLML